LSFASSWIEVQSCRSIYKIWFAYISTYLRKSGFCFFYSFFRYKSNFFFE
jgi:hypothetical protein